MAIDSIISLEGVSIYQRDNMILANVSLHIHKSEFVYLVGKTGTGKSSLMKTLYADLPLREGKMEVAGYNIADLKHKDIPYLRRKIGIVFQDFQLRHVGSAGNIGRDVLKIFLINRFRNSCNDIDLHVPDSVKENRENVRPAVENGTE